MCGKPDCKHEDENCDAFYGMGFGYFDGALNSVGFGYDGSQLKVIKMNPDGTDRRVVTSVDAKEVGEGSLWCAFHHIFLYYSTYSLTNCYIDKSQIGSGELKLIPIETVG